MKKTDKYDSIRVRTDTYRRMQAIALSRSTTIKDLFEEVIDCYENNASDVVTYVEVYPGRPGVTLMIEHASTARLKPFAKNLGIPYVDAVEMMWRWYVSYDLNSNERKIVKLY